MILAQRIEQRFSKQEILYLYLNQIYFGEGAYGIGEAARTYFDKAVEDLTISEGAQLAGLPKAPSRYTPFGNPEVAEQRRLYVLDRMLENEFLEAEAYDEAVADRPALVDASAGDSFEVAAYFTEEVRRYLFDALGGDTVLNGGLRVETTMDLELQRAAVAAAQRGLEDLDKRQGFRGTLRSVAAEEVPAELERLAIENGFAADPTEEPEDPEAALEIELAAAKAAEAAALEAPLDPDAEEPEDALAALRALLPEDESLIGVVTSVEAEAEIARVGFSPGISALVRLQDADWARQPNPDASPQPVKKIERIFRVGDVARFSLLPPLEEPVAEDSPAHGALLATLHQEPQVQGALLSLDVKSGDVLALVGGYDYAGSEFDRVTQARRQPGSAFKPLIYGTALSLEDEEGGRLYTPASIIHDRPKVYVDHAAGFVWRPENYGRKFFGPITLRKALAKSVNNAAVHLCDQIGVGNVINYAQRLGIRSPMERSLALALGSSEVSLLELTRAYAVFPAGGRRVVPRYIRSVTNLDGEVLLENVMLGDPFVPEEPTLPEEEIKATELAAAALLGEEDGEPPIEEVVDPDQLIPPEDAYLMTDMLRAVVLEGTGWRLRKLARPVSGKTGTTNGQADAWFMGFSPEIATGVWVGHDVSRFLGWGETGSRAAAPIWVDYMRTALAGRSKRDFDTPDSIIFTRIDRKTGLLATHNSGEAVFQAFIAGTEPTETADTHRNTSDALRDLREDSLSQDSAARMMQQDAF